MARVGFILGALLALLCFASVSDAGWPSSGRKYPATTSQLISQWNYVTSGTLASGDSDTRSTTATYFNASNVLSSAAINVGRIDYTGGSAQGWLNENASTNLSYPSVMGASEQNTAVTVTPNSAVAPDGTSTLALIAETSATNSHFTQVPSGNNITFVNGTTYASSEFFEQYPSSITYAQFEINGGPFGVTGYVNFNVASGAITSSGASIISSIGRNWNGVTQIAITETATASSNVPGPTFIFNNNNASAAFAPSYAGNVSHEIYAWGRQVEVGTFSTSYIPTTTIAVTRAADVAANANWWNGSTGNYLMVESTSEATGITSRASYCASGCTGTSFVAPTALWIRQICQYYATTPGAVAAQTEAAQSNGHVCS